MSDLNHQITVLESETFEVLDLEPSEDLAASSCSTSTSSCCSCSCSSATSCSTSTSSCA